MSESQGLKFLNEIHRQLQETDLFAAAALRTAIDYAKTSSPGCEISLAVVHLAITIGEYKKQIAGVTADSEEKLAAIDAKTA